MTLLARLERAEEGSRELDALIARHLGYVPSWSDSDGTRFYPPGVKSGDCRLPPPFTTRVDAALTLVPEGWDFVECNSNGDRWFVVLGYGDHCHPRYREAWSWAGEERDRCIFRRKPFPLAICIAAIRAKAAP